MASMALHENDVRRNSRGEPVPVTSFTQTQKCCSRIGCAKYGLFVVNFLVWAAGGVLIGVGIWYSLQRDTVAAFDTITVDVAYLLVGIGAVMFVLGLFGCLGALRESLCLLKVYVVTVVAVFVAQMVAGVLAFVLLDTVENSMMQELRAAILHYHLPHPHNTSMDTHLDHLQTDYSCCGGASYRDWEASPLYNCSSSNSTSACDVPPSCCLRIEEGCGDKVLYSEEETAKYRIHTRGCIGALMNIYKDNLIIIGLIAFSVGFLQVFSLIMAHCLMRYIASDDKLAF